jgi:hypothetical protein
LKRRALIGRIGLMATALALLATSLGMTVLANDPDEIAPAPASIGADVPLTYFGPSGSKVQKELIGPLQLLNSGTVDQDKGTITLPLYRGETKNGKNVWYVLTDTTDKGNADALGLNFSPKLAYAAAGNAARTATLRKDAILVFDQGSVDFRPERKIVPGDAPNFFPPKTAEPGSIGSADYSPLVRITNAAGQIYNAPVIAFDVAADKLKYAAGKVDFSVVHDKVVSIDATPDGGTVTLRLTTGFSFARPVLYLSTDANDPLAASFEGATLAPGLKDVEVGGDDSAFSGVERIFAAVNGPIGAENGRLLPSCRAVRRRTREAARPQVQLKSSTEFGVPSGASSDLRLHDGLQPAEVGPVLPSDQGAQEGLEEAEDAVQFDLVGEGDDGAPGVGLESVDVVGPEGPRDGLVREPRPGL